LVVAVGLFVFALPGSVQAGKLANVRSEVRSPSGSSSSSSSSPSRSHSARPVRSTSTTAYRTTTYRYGTTTSTSHVHTYRQPPSSSSQVDAERPTIEPTRASYGAYPYEVGNKGYVKRRPAHEHDNRDLTAGSIRVEGGYAGDRVWRTGGALSLDWWRFGLDANVHFFFEQDLSDSMYLGRVNAPFAIVMRPHLILRLGPGVHYMIDGRPPGKGRRDYAAGLGGTTSVEIFPAKPVLLSGHFDFGRIYKTPTLTIRGQVGFIVERWELYLAYEYKRVGDVPLSGPLLGVRAWF
jgi:hypothetical protein